MPITVILNGQQRAFDSLSSTSNLADLIEALDLKQDRVALELNGELAPRSSWSQQILSSEDKIELVHFVGGGTENESDA